MPHPDVKASVAVGTDKGVVLPWVNIGDTHSHGPGNALITFEAFNVWGGHIHAVSAFFPFASAPLTLPSPLRGEGKSAPRCPHSPHRVRGTGLTARDTHYSSRWSSARERRSNQFGPTCPRIRLRRQTPDARAES